MATYDSYKDSGVKWIGPIPSHWEVKQLRAYFERRNRRVSDKDFAPLSVTKNGIVPQLENVAKSKDNDNRRLVKVGDFVINSRSDRKGSSGVSELEGSVSFVNTIMMPSDNILSSFCNYLLKSHGFVEENYRNGHGIAADLWTTSYDEQKFIKLAVPPVSEQQAIVAYLDEETGKIDRAIEAHRQMIDALNERKQIIITRAVTRGINPDAPLRDSGIPWLGQIPKHWEMRPLRHTFEMRNGYTPSKADPTLWGGNIPWYRMEDIRKTGRFLNESIDRVTKKALGAKGTFKAGSYILAICTASIGEHAMQIADSQANQQFANLKIRKSLEHRRQPMFIFYYMFVVGDYCRDNANSTCFQYVDMAALKNFLVPIPPVEEQNVIVDYLVNGTKEVEEALLNCERMISLLQERKQIIINEVVTGKKKVI